jgi:hypothetical protein
MKMVEEIVTDYLRALAPDDRHRFYSEFESYCKTEDENIINNFYIYLPPPPKKLVEKWGSSMFAGDRKDITA